MLYSYGLDQHNFTLAMLLVALVWGVSMLQEKFNKDGMTIRDVIAKQNILFRWLLYLALIAGILYLECTVQDIMHVHFSMVSSKVCRVLKYNCCNE